MSADPVSDETLTEKEKIILQSLADGDSLDAAAVLVGIKYSTARQYIDSVKDKLGCRTTVNVVVTAVRRGIID